MNWTTPIVALVGPLAALGVSGSVPGSRNVASVTPRVLASPSIL